jgi:hypothetical protein
VALIPTSHAVMGMALGVSGEVTDENCKLRHDHSNHGEPSGLMDGKRQGIAVSPEPPGLVYCTKAHKEDDHILFGNGGGAGMCGEE